VLLFEKFSKILRFLDQQNLCSGWSYSWIRLLVDSERRKREAGGKVLCDARNSDGAVWPDLVRVSSLSCLLYYVIVSFVTLSSLFIHSFGEIWFVWCLFTPHLVMSVWTRDFLWPPGFPCPPLFPVSCGYVLRSPTNNGNSQVLPQDCPWIGRCTSGPDQCDLVGCPGSLRTSPR
jgi:hypothetical protein